MAPLLNLVRTLAAATSPAFRDARGALPKNRRSLSPRSRDNWSRCKSAAVFGFTDASGAWHRVRIGQGPWRARNEAIQLLERSQTSGWSAIDREYRARDRCAPCSGSFYSSVTEKIDSGQARDFSRHTWTIPLNTQRYSRIGGGLPAGYPNRLYPLKSA